MELKQLEFFMRSVEVGSFKGAAAVLYTTQPNVSKIVHSLETELGTDLLERTPKGVILTKDGESVYRYAKQIIPYINEIKNISVQKEKVG